MARDPDDYVDAALTLLDAHGIADPSYGFTMRAAAASAGVTRSTIYRHWDATVALNDDIARFMVADADGWQHRAMAFDPAGDLGDSLGAAVRELAQEPGVACRLLLTGWPEERPGYEFGRRWESRWLDSLTALVGAHLAATGRRPAAVLLPPDGALDEAAADAGACRSIALTIAAVTEGTLIVDLYRHGSRPEDWDPGVADDIGTAASATIDELSEPAPEGWESPLPAATTGDLPGSGLAGAKLAALGRIVDFYREHPYGEEGSPAPPRLVDLARLARTADVSERWLYDLWPTPADGNMAIIRGIARREEETVQGLAYGILDVGLGTTRYASFSLLIATAIQSVMTAMVRRDRVHVFACAQAAMDPEVREAMVELIDGYLGFARSTFLAILSMTGRFRRVDVSAERYVNLTIASIVGMQRLGALHPEVLLEKGWYEGSEIPRCGMAALLIGRAVTTAEPPTAPPTAGEAPPLVIGSIVPDPPGG